VSKGCAQWKYEEAGIATGVVAGITLETDPPDRQNRLKMVKNG